MAHIYKLTNLVNHKIYIGQSVQTPAMRWRAHRYASNSTSDQYISKAIRKHGIENFTHEILHEGIFTKEELDSLEQLAIINYNSLAINHCGYNVQSGGKGALASNELISQLISEGKLKANTKRPDVRIRMLARTQQEVQEQASKGGKSLKGKPKKGDKTRKGSEKHAHAKRYQVINPEGREFVVTNLSEFCRNNGLSIPCMLQVASISSSVSSHRGGWKCHRLDYSNNLLL
jgi:group I intron endonuclease